MVWSPPPNNPIRHIANGDRTLCDRRIGRCWIARGDDPATCPKCAKLAKSGAAA